MADFLQTLWQRREASGWDSLAGPWLIPKPTRPEPTTQRLHYVAYDNRTGVLAIHRIDSERGPVERVWDTRWQRGWTSFFAFPRLYEPKFLAYRADTGRMEVHEVQQDGRGLDLVWRGSSTPGWTSLMPFLLRRRLHYLSYNAASGAVAINRLADDGRGSQELWSSVWSLGWTSFTPFVLANHPCYLAYKAGDGTVNLDRIRADGRGVDSTFGPTWTPGWGAVVARVSGTTVTFLAVPQDGGTADIEHVDPSGPAAASVWQGDITPGWTSVLPLSVRGPDLLILAHDRRTRHSWIKRWRPTSYRLDIRPLFRDKDVEEMKRQRDVTLDLSSYADVKANALTIYGAVRPGGGFSRMPCDGPWPLEWVTLFKQWIDEGTLA